MGTYSLTAAYYHLPSTTQRKSVLWSIELVSCEGNNSRFHLSTQGLTTLMLVQAW